MAKASTYDFRIVAYLSPKNKKLFEAEHKRRMNENRVSKSELFDEIVSFYYANKPPETGEK